MKPKLLAALALLAASVPAQASAEVRISEVAWMGTDEGATCEWIELHNDGDEVVSLSGWSLVIENPSGATTLDLGNPASVKYSGIAAGGYYLVVRDSPNSGNACRDLFPGKHADWLGSFGSGISNDGAKLALMQGASEEAMLDSKASWSAASGGAGGKNSAPKETPQWTGSAWHTAPPTPRGPNALPPLEELPEEEEEGQGAPVPTVGGTAPLVPVKHPVPTLYVDGGSPRIVFAGADTPFSAIAYDSTGDIRENADISWSFGDGGHEKGDEAVHAYRAPGAYTAVVRARVKGLSAVALIPIEVIEPSVTIESASEDGVTLRNDGEVIADLSGWRIGSGRKAGKLPPDTVLAPGASVLFAYETLRIQGGSAPELRYPNGRLADAFVQPAIAGTSSELVREVEPLRAQPAQRARPHADAMPAPVAEAALPAAGAAASADAPTVLLKEEGKGVAGFFASLVASFASVVVP